MRKKQTPNQRGRKKERQARRRQRRHEHRSVLRGEAHRRALAAGDATAFVWVCDDPECKL